MNVAEFLEARIAEDEAAAEALLSDLEGQIAEEYVGAVDEKGPMTPARLLSAQMWAHYDGQSKRRSFAKGQQIATLANPARVLAECAAKRAILRRHATITVWPDGTGGAKYYYGSKQVCASCDERTETPCPTVRLVAAVYKDHPDYDAHWAL